MNIVRSLSCVLLFGCLSLAACGSHPTRDETPKKKPASTDTLDAKHTQLSEAELRKEADTLYRHARSDLDAHDYTTAITSYDKLIARYPFTDYGTQAEMEKVFAQYKSYQFDDAASAADHFLRDHPRHPRVDYVQYLKGLIEFDRNASMLESLPIDTTKADVGADHLAFNDFALLIQKYPNSRYVADARLRMIYLRNRVAQHEISIVRFYMRRGAYLAAARRCEEIIANYPGAPATGEALQVLAEAYRDVGLTQEADAAHQLILANPGLMHPVRPVAPARVLVAGEPGVAPAAAEAPPPLPQSKGFFSWFTGLFSIFDTTKPEKSSTAVNPTAVAATPSPAVNGSAPTVAPAAATPASTAPAAAPSTTDTAAPPAPATAPASTTGSGAH